MQLEKIINVCSEAEKGSLELLKGAVEKTGEAYKAEYSAGKMADYEAASAAFDRKTDQLATKYAAELGDNEQKHVSWDDFKETKNRSAVWRFLGSLGYDIPQRTFQRHAKDGDIKKNNAGVFTKILTRKYIKSQGLLSDKDDSSEPTMEVVMSKAVREDEKLKYQVGLLKNKFEKDSGNLGSRSEFNFELAARWAFADNFLRSFGEHYAPELIAISGGNQDKRDDFAAFWTVKFDETMRGFAKPLNFNVIFKNDGERSEEDC